MKKHTKKASGNTLDDIITDEKDNTTFQVIFEQSPISTQIFSPDGTLIKVNTAWENLWGTTLENVRGYNILKDKQLVDLKIMPLIKKAFKGEVIELPPMSHEPSKTKQDMSSASFRWTKSLIYPIKDSKNQINKVVLVHEDITEQKLNEKNLIDSEERFKALIEKSTDAIQLVSSAGVILYTSESIKNVLGYSPEELKGQKVGPFVHPEDLEYFSKKVHELLKNPEKHIAMQYRVKHKDGSWAWLETTGVNHLKTPYINALVGNFRNITKSMEYLEELRYQKSLLEAQRELSPEGVLVVSPEGKMVSYNKKFVQMWKFSNKLMAEGKDQLALEEATSRLEDPEKFIKRVKELYKNHQADYEELHFKDGRIFDRYGAPVIGDNGTDYGYVWFFQDVTKRKQLERQKDDFISIASHELKTPVTSIKSYAQVLQLKFKKDGNRKAAELLGKMDAQIGKLTNLIGDLLDVTKMDTNSIQFKKNSFSFDELVKELIEEMQRTTDKHELILNGKTNKNINADRDRIGQVLTNLISNAIKYSPHTKKIIISSEVKNEQIILSVEDFGVGIPKNEQEKIFERFFRISGPGRETFPGLGLGLYISSEIIKRQGGKLWVESTVGKGSKFCVRLPLKSRAKNNLKNNLAEEELKHD